MKRMVLLFACVAAAIAATQIPSLPEVHVTVKTIDEEERPLAGVNVLFTFREKLTGKEAPANVRTNSDGIAASSGPSLDTITGLVSKPGYYDGSFESDHLGKIIDGKWEKSEVKKTVVVRKMVKPIPMCAKKVDTDVPAVEVPIGFDLAEGDWVAPHGRGKTSDLMFTLNRRFKDDRDYESSLVVSFSAAADGIQPWDNNAGYYSALKLPRLAPENGYAQPLVLSNRRLPGSFVERDVKEERNYFFRVRTVLDQQGKVVSALYGKIDGDIRFSPIRSKTCSLMFTYYLNPTLNDRNMEFDPKRNLLTGLKEEQQVTAP